MVVAVVLHFVLRKAYDYFSRADSYTKAPLSAGRRNHLTHGLTVDAAADTRLEQRLSFDLTFAFVFIVALYGISIVKILLILYVNFNLAMKLPREYVPVATWGFNIAILFSNELCNGYSFASVAALLASSDTGRTDSWGAWLDSYGGLVGRWEVLFKITILRMISFNMDYYWSRQGRGSSLIEVSRLYTHQNNICSPAKEETA